MHKVCIQNTYTIQSVKYNEVYLYAHATIQNISIEEAFARNSTSHSNHNIHFPEKGKQKHTLGKQHEIWARTRKVSKHESSFPFTFHLTVQEWQSTNKNKKKKFRKNEKKKQEFPSKVEEINLWHPLKQLILPDSVKVLWICLFCKYKFS